MVSLHAVMNWVHDSLLNSYKLEVWMVSYISFQAFFQNAQHISYLTSCIQMYVHSSKLQYAWGVSLFFKGFLFNNAVSHWLFDTFKFQVFTQRPRNGRIKLFKCMYIHVYVRVSLALTVIVSRWLFDTLCSNVCTYTFMSM
jgi:hypothetical protein